MRLLRKHLNSHTEAYKEYLINEKNRTDKLEIGEGSKIHEKQINQGNFDQLQEQYEDEQTHNEQNNEEGEEEKELPIIQQFILDRKEKFAVCKKCSKQLPYINRKRSFWGLKKHINNEHQHKKENKNINEKNKTGEASNK
ncbi:hypothetical protein Mgra_00003760 [Meloidogyne graminicola]|uniref:BED-type domain-containing protein n=1 Tax=Meloidogyne graminicola TaxID=189291 RepID=A0A8S9ZU62_9BILA|nr:hypothetical protein Mgra_00003760 [Meloidogyne graminicola]